MHHRSLRIRAVRRYRRAAYPSRHRHTRRRSTPLAAAAAPAAALGLGALAAPGCDDGLLLAGSGPDAGPDTVEAEADAPPPEDITPTDDAGSPEDAPDVWIEEGMMGDMPAGTRYVRYLSEAEGRALLRTVVEEVTGSPASECERPGLAERIAGTPEDTPWSSDGVPAVDVRVDLLAPEISVERTPLCPGGHRPAVGFEFLTEEAGDDEDTSGNPAGFSDAEETALDRARTDRVAALARIRSADFPFDVWEYEGGYTDDSDRLRAEELLRGLVRSLLDDLRRDGLL